jgi:outer membrane protein OmpA-like peptidoglycan-associated protein
MKQARPRQILKQISRVSLLALACSLTSGCIMYRLEELRNTTPSGTPFQTELSRMYMDFATKEEKDYDWRNSWHFADKGLMLAYGKDVGPEELDDWSLPGDARMEIEKVRIRVMDMLSAELKASEPSRAAAIQFYFDCWVEQQEENWQEDDIAFCRENLIHALGDGPTTAATGTKYKPVKTAKLKALPTVEVEKSPRNVMPAKAAAVKTASARKEAPAAKEVLTETASYAVFFEPGKAEVSGPGKNVLNEIVNSVKGKSDYIVILHVAAGAAGESGKDLPAKRVDVVKKTLANGGVNENDIVNADSAAAAKPVSRRIELFLNE